jgi:hypothetical protein
MKTNNIFEKREEDLKADMAETRRDRAAALRRVRILETEVLELRESVDELADKEGAMEECWQKECGRLAIRDGGRGQPVGDKFVRHVRCLLATGSSARSCREQLLLSGQYFPPEVLEAPFCDDVPQLRWFNTQRKAMGNEAYLYALTSLAKCDEKVEQWGFDETSLDGVPRFNQWCRIREGDSYKVVTMECSGLLPGASAELVAEHVRRTWERGKEALDLLRHELGEEADALVPLVNGGVTFAKLQSVMHDTCNQDMEDTNREARQSVRKLRQELQLQAQELRVAREKEVTLREQVSKEQRQTEKQRIACETWQGRHKNLVEQQLGYGERVMELEREVKGKTREVSALQSKVDTNWSAQEEEIRRMVQERDLKEQVLSLLLLVPN